MKKRGLLITACLSAAILATACTKGEAPAEPSVDVQTVDIDGGGETEILKKAEILLLQRKQIQLSLRQRMLRQTAVRM